MKLDNLNVAGSERLATPSQLKRELPLDSACEASVNAGRMAVNRVLRQEDHRLIVVVGPCSIHDPVAAMEYAERLAALSADIGDSLLIVMRAYFEKPRTTVGWKGLINDPDLNDTFEVGRGLRLARSLLLDIARLGLPLATEALDPISPQYLQDLMSWSAIGARTTESQTHREMASGLSCAVGFKNGTDGGLTVAVNALQSVQSPHSFLGIDQQGQVSVVHTRGNPHAHIVLRGGHGGPNYEAEHVRRCEEALTAANLPARNIMIDCSHANSSKQHERQVLVARDVLEQIVGGNRSISGLMLESNLGAGNQNLTPGGEGLEYGVSITDACIDWPTTETLLRELAASLEEPLQARQASVAA